MKSTKILLVLLLFGLLSIHSVASELLLQMNTSLHASGEDGNRVLYGRVTDEKGEPLPGVAVFPTNFVEFGAATDENGRYVLKNVPSQAKSVTFLMLGMMKEILMIGKKDMMDVMLIEDANSLEDVVVTGYQKIDRRYSTSAGTSMKMEDVHIPGYASLDQMLEG